VCAACQFCLDIFDYSFAVYEGFYVTLQLFFSGFGRLRLSCWDGGKSLPNRGGL
jgi:hypothetical protein